MSRVARKDASSAASSSTSSSASLCPPTDGRKGKFRGRNTIGDSHRPWRWQTSSPHCGIWQRRSKTRQSSGLSSDEMGATASVDSDSGDEESTSSRVAAVSASADGIKSAGSRGGSQIRLERENWWRQLSNGICAVCVPLSVFGLVAQDVFGEGSAHLTSALDMDVHVIINEFTSEDFRNFWAGRLLSNAPWITCVAMLLPSTAFVAIRRGRKGILTAVSVAAVVLAFAYGGGYEEVHDDGAHVHAVPSNVISAMKRSYHRHRPDSRVESTYAFPSGHTFVATGSASALFLFVYPVMLVETPGPSSDGHNNSGFRKGVSIVACVAMLTAMGRILADVHWVTDTVAGGCLGAAAGGAMFVLRGMLTRAVDSVFTCHPRKSNGGGIE